MRLQGGADSDSGNGGGGGGGESTSTSTSSRLAAALPQFNGYFQPLPDAVAKQIRKETGLSREIVATLVARSTTPKQCWLLSASALALSTGKGVRTIGGGIPALRLCDRVCDVTLFPLFGLTSLRFPQSV
jgi:hypothetical protein